MRKFIPLKQEDNEPVDVKRVKKEQPLDAEVLQLVQPLRVQLNPGSSLGRISEACTTGQKRLKSIRLSVQDGREADGVCIGDVRTVAHGLTKVSIACGLDKIRRDWGSSHIDIVFLVSKTLLLSFASDTIYVVARGIAMCSHEETGAHSWPYASSTTDRDC